MNEVYIRKRLKRYCRNYTEIENYEKALKDDFHGWICHHRLELTLDGELANTPEQLIRLGMYYHRPAFELIFLTREEHQILHNKGNKNKFTEERRKNISKGVKKAYKDPSIKEKMDKTRYKFPLGNYFGKIR